MKNDAFHAIADPTRRTLIYMTLHHAWNLSTLSAKFTISRQAVSKHIRILTDSGLLTIHRQGRVHFYSAQQSKLNEVSSWLEDCRMQWEKKFLKLDNLWTKLRANHQDKLITQTKRS